MSKPGVLLASVARLHIVAIGAMGTLTFAWALTGTFPVALALLAAVDWFVVNLLNRVVDLEEDLHNGIAGTQAVADRRRAVIAVGVALLVGSLLVTAWLMPALVPLRVGFHVLGFFYNWPLLPGRVRIKQLLFWKNTASATGFLITCFGYPLVAARLLPEVDTGTVVATALFFFLFELSYEVLYDLRDLPGDARAGIRSWPVVLGARGGSLVALGLMGASFVVVGVSHLLGLVPWRVAIMGAAPLLQAALVWRRLPLAGPGSVTSGLCIGITWLGVALLAGWHVWERLGLPGSGP